jgi:hypothetical protein
VVNRVQYCVPAVTVCQRAMWQQSLVLAPAVG